jgi:hypothetical protein
MISTRTHIHCMTRPQRTAQNPRSTHHRNSQKQRKKTQFAHRRQLPHGGCVQQARRDAEHLLLATPRVAQLHVEQVPRLWGGGAIVS